MPKMYHAHEGECVVPPRDGWACPYTTQQAARVARMNFAPIALAFAYDNLANLTTREFTTGGDRPARKAIDALYMTLTGNATLDS